MDSNYCCGPAARKNEVGSGGCDLFMDAVAYYHKNVDRRIIQTSNAPCSIVEIVGPQLAIAGAVMSDSILVDRKTRPTPLSACLSERACSRCLQLAGET